MFYDASGEITGFIYNNAYYYYQKNLQGDVVRIVNSGGTVVVEYTYDAWGNVLSVTGSQANTIGHYNPFRYRGYYYDSETGWYYLQSRYYDPVVGRFLNEDDATMIGANGTVVGHNIFAYSNNNPIMFTDHTGYDAIILVDNGPLPPHMGALIQDEDGNWWHFYWGPSSIGWGVFNALTVIPVQNGAWCNSYDGKLEIDSINSSGDYDTYDEMIYLTGDFSSVIDDAQNVGGLYHLYTNNCIHVTLRLLAAANTKYSLVLKTAAALPTIYQSANLIGLYNDLKFVDIATEILMSEISNTTEKMDTKVSTKAKSSVSIRLPSNCERFVYCIN